MTKIQWTDVTDNPIYLKRPDGTNGGHWCKKKSPGCANCFSEEINQSNYFGFASHLMFGGEVPKNLDLDRSILWGWKRKRSPKKRFVCSMTDLFGEWVPREWQLAVFDAAKTAPSQTIQLLTKRPDIALDAAREWCRDNNFNSLYLPKNVWMGVSIEDQERADDRRQYWREMSILADVTWVSYEPALENVEWDGWELIKWMVIGGESGKKARPFDLEWANNAISFCKSWNIAPFMKQVGSHPIMPTRSPDHPGWEKLGPIYRTTGKGGNIEELPESVQVREFPVQISNYG